MGEMIQKNEYDELKEKYDDVSSRLAEVQEGCDKYEDLYHKYSDKYYTLAKELDKFVSENAKLKEDYNNLVDENKILTETLDKFRTKPGRSETLDRVLSETPSVVINTKSINIVFDNHTNNFKEDDAE